MYAGGPAGPVVELLAEDVVWHVPGESPIAGDHRGRGEVLDYFEKRRRLASSTMRMAPGAAVSEGPAVAQFVEGRATVDGELLVWQTIGVYRVEAGRIREVWLVPLDLDQFDRIWSSMGEH